MPFAPTVETVPVAWLRAVLTTPDALIDHVLPEPSATFATSGAVRVQGLGDTLDEDTGLRRSLAQVDIYAYKPTTDAVTPDRPDWSKAMQIAEELLAAVTARPQHRTVTRTGYWDARVLNVARLEGPIRMPDPHRMARVRVDVAVSWTKASTST